MDKLVELAERCEAMREYRGRIYNTNGDGVDVLLEECAAALRSHALKEDSAP